MPNTTKIFLVILTAAAGLALIFDFDVLFGMFVGYAVARALDSWRRARTTLEDLTRD